MLPTVHTSGMRLKARGCSSFSGTNSATAVLMIPTFPFDSPCNDLAMNAHIRDLEKPKSTLDIIVQVRAPTIIGFRPHLSEARPHAMPVRHCESEKIADIIPAYLATLSSGMLKDLTISGYVRQFCLTWWHDSTHNVWVHRCHCHWLCETACCQNGQLLLGQSRWAFALPHNRNRAWSDRILCPWDACTLGTAMSATDQLNEQ